MRYIPVKILSKTEGIDFEEDQMKLCNSRKKVSLLPVIFKNSNICVFFPLFSKKIGAKSWKIFRKYSL